MDCWAIRLRPPPRCRIQMASPCSNTRLTMDMDRWMSFSLPEPRLRWTFTSSLPLSGRHQEPRSVLEMARAAPGSAPADRPVRSPREQVGGLEDGLYVHFGGKGPFRLQGQVVGAIREAGGRPGSPDHPVDLRVVEIRAVGAAVLTHHSPSNCSIRKWLRLIMLSGRTISL